MVVKIINDIFKYHSIRRGLKKGKTLKLTVKIGKDYFLRNGEDGVKVLLNTECHKQMIKYNLELSFEYEFSINSNGISIAIIKLKLNK